MNDKKYAARGIRRSLKLKATANRFVIIDDTENHSEFCFHLKSGGLSNPISDLAAQLLSSMTL